MISKISTLETVKQAFFRKRDILKNEHDMYYYCSDDIINEYKFINKKDFQLYEYLNNNTQSNKTQQEIKLCEQLFKYVLRINHNNIIESYTEYLNYTCINTPKNVFTDMIALCNRKDDFIEINQNQNQN
jgi:hypothetical protein